MKRHFLIASAVLALGMGLGACEKPQQIVDEVPAKNASEITAVNWQDQIQAVQTSSKLVGVGSVVMKDGEIVETAFAGEKRLNKGEAIEADELWHIGSITKSITATMIGRLVEQKTLNWNTKVGDVFGVDNIDPAWANVTLTQLLTHTSGAQANFSPMAQSVWPGNEAALTEARLTWVGGVLDSAPKSTPGEGFVYSNVGYTIAGVMAQVITGESWETLVRREVFEPLGLKSAGFGAPHTKDGTIAAWGHSASVTGKKSHDPADRSDNTPIMGPAGTVHMTLQDLARFGNEHVKGMNSRSDFLSAATFERLHTVQKENYAMGWVELGDRKWADGSVTFHNGSNTMWYALLVLLKDQNKVYVAATNDGNVQAAEGAFFKAISENAAASKEME